MSGGIDLTYYLTVCYGVWISVALYWESIFFSREIHLWFGLQELYQGLSIHRAVDKEPKIGTEVHVVMHSPE